MKLFRSEAIEAKRHRLWGDVRLAQPPSLMIWTMLLAVVCLIMIVALVFGRYTRKETVNGFLAPEAGVVQIRATAGGRVERVFVGEGEMVQAGAPLLELVSDAGSLSRGPALDLQIEATDLQAGSVAERRRAVDERHNSEHRRLSEQVATFGRRRSILIDQRDTQADALRIAEEDAARFARLQAQGYAPSAEVDRRRRAVIAERGALADLENRILETEALAAEARTRLMAVPAQRQTDLADLSIQAAGLAQRRSELEVARGYVLRAPITGRVSSLQARVGQTPADLPLMSIAPDSSNLQAYLLVPTRAAGFIQRGQEARLQIQAFPFQRFGFVQGRIESVSGSVIRPGDAAFPIDHSEPAYEVRVVLERDYVDAYGQRRPLQPGMALTADIPIDRRRLWQQLFDPLLATGRRVS